MAKRAQGFENRDFSKIFGDFNVPNMPEMKFEELAAALLHVAHRWAQRGTVPDDEALAHVRVLQG